MKEFITLLDISDNIELVQKAVASVKSMGVIAIWFCCLAPVTAVFLYLSWIFDISSTWEWSQDFFVFVESMTSNAIIAIGIGRLILVMMTFFPTLSEISIGRLADHDIPFMRGIVYFSIAFDLRTDYDRAAMAAEQFLYPVILDLVGNNYWSVVLFFVVKWFFVFVASVVFEVITITLFATLLFLAIQFGKVAGESEVFQGQKKFSR